MHPRRRRGQIPSGSALHTRAGSGVRAQHIEARDQADAETGWCPPQENPSSVTQSQADFARRVNGVPPGRGMETTPALVAAMRELQASLEGQALWGNHGVEARKKQELPPRIGALSFARACRAPPRSDSSRGCSFGRLPAVNAWPRFAPAGATEIRDFTGCSLPAGTFCPLPEKQGRGVPLDRAAPRAEAWEASRGHATGRCRRESRGCPSARPRRRRWCRPSCPRCSGGRSSPP